MNFLVTVDNRNRAVWAFAGFALIVVVGLLDLLTGFELTFGLFYLIPIYLVVWFGNRRLGVMAAFASAIVWLAADWAAGNTYSHPSLYVWNTLVRLGNFIVFALLLSELRRALVHERELAHTDYLTGAANSRSFFELAQAEIDRFQRYQHPFSIAYMDLDNFKTVNDRYGHEAGDQVLRTVVDHVVRCSRKTDVIARLGGDEFALLLPETDQEAAKVAISKLQSCLLEAMRRSNWPITFSIGLLTCSDDVPHTADDLIKVADDLMYSVKRDRKNAVQCASYTVGVTGDAIGDVPRFAS